MIPEIGHSIIKAMKIGLFHTPEEGKNLVALLKARSYN